MTISVATASLVDLLTDALHTAAPHTGGVHLSSHRAPWKEEPGDVDLLAATSTTGSVVGHMWIPVEGNLTSAVWPVGSTTTALGVLRRLAKKGDNHSVDIDMYQADPPENLKEGEHPGWIVTIAETSALFDSDTEFQFHAHDASKFPLRRAGMLLRGQILKADDDEEDYAATPLTLWSAGVMGPLVKVAKRRGGTIRLFRSSDQRTQLVQIGDTWIGAAYPSPPLPGEPKDAPSIEPVLDGGESAAGQTTIDDEQPGD
ncbi:Uncharacterised protein [Mycolicibacterium vanbaalenii]|uniref:Uncharacterized protein n=1 Tax=Mycolicibacterium vanbaalenii TaxID=110539 RepID=A0A5S9R5Z4_MYCVN|nr:DNA translocase FtsK [Mycolicibacterium vanbaalenii]CAA0129283.1 Uncharacterised protein [Mycolicibacterium vanbaalenii]